jgi:t-SNARE complex subunit (syntaxin)
MSTEESLIQLLTDIRDIQREHMELYRRNSEAAIAKTEAAMGKQDQALEVARRFQRFYRIVVAVLFVAIAALLLWLFL